MRNFFNVLVFFFTVSSLLFVSARMNLVKADTLVIEDDGTVTLVLDEGVLGISTGISIVPTVKAKAIELATPGEESKVKIEPSQKGDKKVEVTITPGSTPKTTTSNPPSPTPAKKEVDQVVARGKSGQVVLTITSTNATTLSIQQGTANASTKLPVQVDSVSHSVSVITTQGAEEKLSVLPKAAVGNVTQNGLSNPTATLSVNQNGPVYSIDAQRKVSVLNLFNLVLPVTVNISARTGRTLNTSYRVFDLLLTK